MAKKEQEKKEMQGWVKNNIEKTGAYHFFLGNADITPDAFIRVPDLDPWTRGLLPDFINRGYLIYSENEGSEDTSTSVVEENKFSRVVTLRDGSKMAQPYKEADSFINMTIDNISRELHDIDDLEIVTMYKERAVQLLKPDRVVNEFEMRIREIKDKR
jgi:hypothetical protein